MGKLLTDEDCNTADEIREAKRVAAIAESMDIIRTLNSHRMLFTVEYNNNSIRFHVDAMNIDVVKIVNPEHCNLYNIGIRTGINFGW